MRNKNIYFILLLATSCLLLTTNIIGAQTALTDIALSVSIPDSAVTNGDIICSDTKGYVLCQNEYDSMIFGVVNDNPSISLQGVGIASSHLVVSRGEVTARVTSAAGNIKKGDYLTSSKKAGAAELAIKTGYILGTALEDYSSGDKNAIGQIKVSLNIHPRIDIVGNTKENLIDLLRNGLSGLGVNPVSAMRYLAASSMVVVSFLVGFLYFGRIAKAGVEAIGRNPLAGIRIQASVILNILIMLVVFLVGLATAYLILAL